MRISNSKELRVRVDAICRKIMSKRFETHPVPDLPTAEAVSKEIEGGKAIAVKKNLAEALKWDGRDDAPVFGEIYVFDCITTPSLDRARNLMTIWKNDLEKFRVELDSARDELLDRIIFDGDAPYPLLQSFRNWKDSKSKAAEPFDGK